MKISDLFETPTAGSINTGLGATVINPHIAGVNKVNPFKKAPKQPKVVQKKNPDGTAKNGLDYDNLFGGKAIKRR